MFHDSAGAHVAELLSAQDYHTVHIGKWHLGRSNGMAPHDQGFAESLLMASGLYLAEDDPNVVNAKLDFDPPPQKMMYDGVPDRGNANPLTAAAERQAQTVAKYARTGTLLGLHCAPQSSMSVVDVYVR